MSKYAYIKTFGCQMNEHDSTKMMLILESLGYASSDDPLEADLVIFNTCSIREKPWHKAMSEMGRSSGIKRRRPDAMVAVCGCVAQQEGTGILERYQGIDFVFGPDQIWRLPELIEEARQGKRAAALELIDDPESYHFLDQTPRTISRDSRVTAFVAVMKGCNCACSYCIVPSVRGREVSRPADDIVEEVRKLNAAGAREVTLLGQNVCAYGKRGADESIDLAALIRRLADETEIERIRFTSPHPRDIGEKIIQEYAENERLCPHIHLPVQAGSDEVLRRMRRGYTRDRYIDTVRKLREARKGISITTDLIVGFCGESDGDYQDTLSLIREVEFDSAFAFMYSPRPGTEAHERLPDDVEQGIKERRLAVLLDLQRGISRRRNEARVGALDRALVYSMDRMKRGLCTGRLPDNRIVHFSGHPDNIGDIVEVKITGANDNSLSGEKAR